jgi:serine/threonine-protein kinase RsbW
LPDQLKSHVTLTLDSTLHSVDQIDRTALGFAKSAGFSDDTAANLALVAREAAVNAVVHGNRYDPKRPVSATFELSPEALTIRVCDLGEGLNPETIPNPLAPENLLRSSGRGVFLMRNFMDEVRFRALHPGTEVTLIKRRTGLA